MIYIMAAFKKEIADLLLLSRVVSKKRAGKTVFYRADLEGREVVIVKTGMGKKVSEHDNFNECDTIISTGFCGALIDNLKSGDIVIPDEVITADKKAYYSMISGGTLPGDPDSFRETYLKVCKTDISSNVLNTVKSDVLPSGLKVFSGTTFSSPKVVKNSAEKKNLHRYAGAIAVDMEDFHRCGLARALRARFIVVRSVLDEIGDDVPGFKDGLRMGRKISSILSKMDMVQQGIAIGVSTLVKIL